MPEFNHSHIVFAPYPFGTTAEREATLALLKAKPEFRKTTEFKNFLADIYQGAHNKSRVALCLEQLLHFAKSTPQLSQETRYNVGKISQLIDSYARVLEHHQELVEDICFAILYGARLPLHTRLRYLSFFLEAIRDNDPDLGSQMRAIHSYLCAGNILQDLSNFAKDALFRLGIGEEGVHIPNDAEPDLIYAYDHGFAILNVEPQPDLPPTGSHNPKQIQSALQHDFRVDKFLDHMVANVEEVLSENFVLSVSAKTFGLLKGAGDARASSRRKMLKDIFSFLAIDASKPEVFNQIFSTELRTPHGLHQFLQDFDLLSTGFDEITFSRQEFNSMAIFIEINDQEIIIWHRPLLGQAQEVVRIPAAHKLYAKIKSYENTDIRLDELCALINQKGPAAYLQLNKDLIKHKMLSQLLHYRILARSGANEYNILRDAQSQEYVKQTHRVNDDVNVWPLVLDGGFEYFIEGKTGLKTFRDLNVAELKMVRQYLLSVFLESDDVATQLQIIAKLEHGGVVDKGEVDELLETPTRRLHTMDRITLGKLAKTLIPGSTTHTLINSHLNYSEMSERLIQENVTPQQFSSIMSEKLIEDIPLSYQPKLLDYRNLAMP